jgi:predicted dehydrogenase
VPVLPTRAVVAWRIERTWRPAADPSYRRALRAFFEQVHGGAPRGATLTDGLRSLETVVAAEEAALPNGGTCASS